MLDSLEDLQRVHPVEDDVLTSLLRVGIAKAVAVIGHCDQVGRINYYTANIKYLRDFQP